MRSIGNHRLLLFALTIAVAATAAIGQRDRALLATSGLTAATWAGVGFRGSPTLQTRDRVLRSETVQAKAAQVGGPSSTEWRGYLIVPVSGSYRFVIIADDRATLDIDRQQVAGSKDHLGAARLELGRGLHPIRLRYEDDGGQQMMEVLWARGTGTPASIPPIWLLPELRGFSEIRQRQVLAWLMPAVALFWSLVLLLAAGAGVRRLVRRLGPGGDRSFAPLVLVVSAVTFTCGLWWGLPDFYGWASDGARAGRCR